jgi:hypothetical protein
MLEERARMTQARTQKHLAKLSRGEGGGGASGGGGGGGGVSVGSARGAGDRASRQLSPIAKESAAFGFIKPEGSLELLTSTAVQRVRL